MWAYAVGAGGRALWPRCSAACGFVRAILRALDGGRGMLYDLALFLAKRACWCISKRRWGESAKAARDRHLPEMVLAGTDELGGRHGDTR